MDIMNLAAKISLDSKGYESALRSSESKFKSFGNNISSWAIAKGQLIADFTKKAASAAGNFIKGSVGEGMAFDSAMAQVAATMGKTMAEMSNEVGKATYTVDGKIQKFSGNLEEFARFMGSNTKYTATEAAEALNYMALAGYSTQQSMDMLPNVLNLASAGAMDLAKASDMVTDTQTAFGIDAKRTAQMVDEMAKAASTGNTSVSQLGEAFLVVGALAQDLSGGMVELADGSHVSTDNVQQMEIALTAMANAGIKGSEAGTHLRNMILKLSSPTKEGSKALKKMGVDVFNAQGEMRSLTDIMTDLGGAFKNMTKEEKLATISDLFNTRDTASVEALLTSIENGDWSKIAEAVTNAQGAAQKMADTQLDNLKGDTEKWKSALGEAKLTIADALTPTLRQFVQLGTNSITRLTKSFKKGGLERALKSLKNIFKETIKEWKKSDNPLFRTLGNVFDRVRLAFTNFPKFIRKTWNDIKQGAANLGGLIFGKNEKGEVKWPTWDDVKKFAKDAWDKIKEAAITLGTEFGKLVFGTTETGDVKWPTWEEVKTFAADAWEKIKSAAETLGNDFGKLVFGTTEKGDVKWPTWDDVLEYAKKAWEDIKTAASTLGTEFGKLIFGTTETGEVKWPTWEEVAETAKTKWAEIKKNAKEIAKTAGKLIFGTKEDGSVDWPTWKTVKARAIGIWETIKQKAKNLKGLIFGDAENAGSVFEGIQSAWNKLRETIEGGAIKVATYFFGEADPTKVAEAIKTIGDVLTGLGAGILTYAVVTRFTKIIEAVKSLFTVGAGTNTTAIVIGAIATAITLLAQNWDKVEPILQSIGEWVNKNIVEPFQNAVEWIKEAIKEIKRFLNIGTNEREGETTLTLGEADKLKVNYKMLQASKKGLDTPVPMSDDIFYTKLRETLEGAGKSAEEIESIVEQIKSSDDPEWVLAFIESLTSAKEEVSGVKEQVDGLPTDKTLNYHILLDDPDGVLSPSETHTPGTQGKIPGKAKGDWNVPYDNFLANLHRGEMVLTSSQARDYRAGNTGADMTGLEDRIIAAIRAGMQNATVNTYLNGRAITDEVNRNNMRDVKGRRFAT